MEYRRGCIASEYCRRASLTTRVGRNGGFHHPGLTAGFFVAMVSSPRVGNWPSSTSPCPADNNPHAPWFGAWTKALLHCRPPGRGRRHVKAHQKPFGRSTERSRSGDRLDLALIRLAAYVRVGKGLAWREE